MVDGERDDAGFRGGGQNREYDRDESDCGHGSRCGGDEFMDAGGQEGEDGPEGGAARHGAREVPGRRNPPPVPTPRSARGVMVESMETPQGDHVERTPAASAMAMAQTVTRSVNVP